MYSESTVNGDVEFYILVFGQVHDPLPRHLSLLEDRHVVAAVESSEVHGLRVRVCRAHNVRPPDVLDQVAHSTSCFVLLGANVATQNIAFEQVENFKSCASNQILWGDKYT